MQKIAGKVSSISAQNAYFPEVVLQYSPVPDGGAGPVDQQLLHPGLLLVEDDQAVVDLLVDALVPVQQTRLHLHIKTDTGGAR